MMGSCQYEIWDSEKKSMDRCGKEGIKVIIPNIEKITEKTEGKIYLILCPEHKKFVIDSLRSEYYIEHKKHINKQKELFRKNKK